MLGGAVYCQGATLSLYNATVDSCLASNYSGGVTVISGTANLYHCTLAGNKVGTNPVDAYRQTGTLNLTNCIATGAVSSPTSSVNTVSNSTGLGAMTWTGTQVGHRPLGSDSPALNAGTTVVASLASDALGQGRAYGAHADCGAVERHEAVVVNPPADFVALPSGMRQVYLGWTDVPLAQDLKIQYSADGSAWTDVPAANLVMSSTPNNYGWRSARHVNLAPGSNLHYRLSFTVDGIAGPIVTDGSHRAATVALSSVPQLSSNPSATKTIFLNFGGYVFDDNGNVANARGTPEFANAKYVSTPLFTFTGSGKTHAQAMTEIYQQVAEDFAIFDVNVTTVEPDCADLVNTGGDDTRYGIRVLLGVPVVDGVYVNWFYRGGVSMWGSFNSAKDEIAFSLANSSVGFIATTATHEVGHTLGLHHDSGNVYFGDVFHGDQSYYTGCEVTLDGALNTSGYSITNVIWTPVMGGATYSDATDYINQWSRHEYSTGHDEATDLGKPTEDDIAIMAGLWDGVNYTLGLDYDDYGLRLKGDDCGDTPAAARVLAPGEWTSGAISLPGVIGKHASGTTVTDDADVYTFRATSSGTLSLRACTDTNGNGTGSYRGVSLDAKVEVLDSLGAVVAQSDLPVANSERKSSKYRDAELQSVGLSPGIYHVRVSGVGRRVASSTVKLGGESEHIFNDFSSYGSVGRYTLAMSTTATLGAVDTTAPTVATTAASGITVSTATAGGNVTAQGGGAVTARGVCWSTDANPTIASSKTTDGSGTGAFASTISGLSPGTTYHFRAYATNAYGTAYGNDLAFTTTVATGNGAWTNAAGGSWPAAGNWSGSVVAAGSGNSARFDMLDLSADATVALDGARTIGSLVFGDTVASHNWVLSSGTGGPLTLAVASGAPTITVGNQTATIGAVLAGSQGFSKAGSGTLILSGANTLTGGAIVNGGRLGLSGGASSPGGALACPSITVNNGATLSIDAQDALGWTAGRNALIINTGGTVTIASGKRATVRNTVNMTGGTLASTGAGDTWGNYSLYGGAGVAATSDAAGASATISCARLALQDSGGQTPFNVSRGVAEPAADLVVTGAIVTMNGSTNGISKSGNGVMVVSGSCNYAGATSVNAGILRVNGSMSGTGNVTVSAGAVLGGSGSLAGATTVNGTLAPGSSTVGKLTVGAIALGATGAVSIDIVANSVTTAGIDYDQLVAPSLSTAAGARIDLVLNGAGSSTDLSTAFWQSVRRFKVVKTTATPAATPSLGTVSDDSTGKSASAYGIFSTVVAADGIEVVWTPGTTPLHAWRLANFGTIVASGISANDADPDHDGRPNLLEYALAGANPVVGDGAGMISSKVFASGADNFLKVFVPASTTATDVTIVVEFGPTPSGPWTAVSTYTTDSDGRRAYVDTTPIVAGSSRFYRIVITPR